MRSILVVNPKGGCGKTTLATNLASYYALWGVPTVLVDVDPQQSSIEWLAARPDTFNTIHGVSGVSGQANIPAGVERVIYDAPARTDTKKVMGLVKMSDSVVIPVLPSAIDIRAVARFVSELLIKGDAKQHTRLIGVVANRVRENTLIYGELEKFLKGLDIPFVTTLRDSMNYIRAANQGIGLFEMAPSAVEVDMAQWKPLINWIEGKSVRTR